MADRLCVGIDIGTSSTKVCLLDEEGRLRWTGTERHPLFMPRADFVEVDPGVLLENVCKLLCRLATEILEKNICQVAEVKAIALANQRETTVFWRRSTGECLGNAIVWSDRRTETICAELIAKHKSADYFKKRNGLPISTYFSAFKLMWALQHHPDVQQARADNDLLFGTVDSWIMFKLLEGAPHITDTSNASRTFLLNLQTLNWDDEIIAELGLDRSVLPKVQDSYGSFGKLAQGPFAGVELRAVLGDQQAAAFGAGALSLGDCSVVFGTGTFLMAPIGPDLRFSKDFLTTILYTSNSQVFYAFEGAAESGGSNLAYISENLPVIGDICTASAQAAALPISAMRRNLYFLGTLTGALAPHWRPEAAGALFGLRNTDRPLDVLVAALEGVAFRLKENLDLLSSNGMKCERLCLGGGLSQADYLVRFLTQLEGRSVLRGKSSYTTAIGVAMLGLKGDQSVESLASFDHHLSLFAYVEDVSTTKFLNEKYARFKELMEFNCMFCSKVHEKDSTLD